jgi:hypothetical protein
VNMNVLDGVQVAEDMQGALVAFDGNSLVGDKIANEAADYE